MNAKNNIIRAIAVIGILTLLTLTVLPGCDFIGQANPDNSDTDGNSVSDTANGDGLQQCCPICTSTDITGPDADGYFTCNACSAKWAQDDTKIDVLDEDNNVVTQLDPSAGYVSGGSNGGSSGGSSNNRPQNQNKPSQTTTTTTTTTTTKSLQQQLDEIKDRWGDVIKPTIDADGNITVESPDGSDTGLFGFKYSQKDNCFITAEDAWQRNFGYNETYDDTSSVIAISYDTIRVYFEYNDLEWMIQYWKGQYGMVLIGAEVGIYHRPKGSSASTHYECANDETKMLQSMTLYRRESSTSNKFKAILTRSPSRTWWCTGFTPGTLSAGGYNVSAEDTATLRIDSKLTLHTPEMAQAFMQGLREVTKIQNNVNKTYRSCKFQEMSIAEYESKTVQSKFALEEDGVTVRVSWR